MDNNVREQLKKDSIYIVDVDKEIPKDLNYEFVILNRDMIIGKEEDFVNNKIEYFPARLFVVDESEFSDEVLKKRICGLHQKEFDQQYQEIKNNENIDYETTEKFKLWLYQKWIEHLMSSLNVKNLKFYVRVKGEEGTGDKEILEYIFNNFKEEIAKLLFDEDDESKGNFINKQIPEDQRPSIFKNEANLLDYWLGDGESDEKKRKQLEGIIEAIKDILVKKTLKTVPTVLGELKGKEINFKFEDWNIPGVVTVENYDMDDLDTIAYSHHADVRLTNNLYAESLSGSQSYFSLFQSKLSDYQEKKFFCQLIENALLRYVIVDERVADYRVKNSDFAERAKAGGIQIPLKIKKYESNEHLTLASGKPEDDSPQDCENCEGDVLIIHQGVLDEICSDREKAKEFVLEKRKKFPFVFITTGRGREGIVKGIKYIPFSNISHYLLKAFPEKFVLTTILMQITVPKDKGTENG